MDHLANAHGIAKDAKHPSILSKQTAQARAECKQRALDAGMTEARFQSICTTRYIIRRLLPFSHVECPEFRATVHSAWKPITAETQRNLVAEMYLLMVAGIAGSAEQGHDGSRVVLGEPCVRGARVLGCHGAAVSAIVAGDD